jgi:glycosyltransferase involved in cell wall biosynthesis
VSAAAPEVSVVVPTRDRWPLLSAHALPSALGQEDVAIEVIVVDDGSADATVEGLRSLHDPRVRVLRHDRARGPAAARNAGVAAARGEWVAFLDDDDLWSPRKLRRQLDAAAAARAGWVYAGSVVVDGDVRPLELEAVPDPDEVRRLLRGGNVVPSGGSNVAARTELVREAGGFDERLRFFEDWDLWLRLALRSQAAACRDVLVARVDHEARVVPSARTAIAQLELVLAKHRPVTRSDRRAVLEWLAFEHHRGGRRLPAAWLYLRLAVGHRSAGNLPPAIGALFGASGMRLASSILRKAGGASHVEGRPRRSPAPPPWLAAYGGGR